ncbi:hypothetical protein HanPSC8_Chr04g0151771 [Helianthus annuus]|nr:hypothetical protein HanPSC8_Chr04g0151771 [Helianthus annuus]
MMTELRHLSSSPADGGCTPMTHTPITYPPLTLCSPSIYTPTPFVIQKRTTTTTNRWWCGGATQREAERRERENRRSKTRTAGRSIYPVVGVKSPAVQDFIQRVFRADGSGGEYAPVRLFNINWFLLRCGFGSGHALDQVIWVSGQVSFQFKG